MNYEGSRNKRQLDMHKNAILSNQLLTLLNHNAGDCCI